MPRNDAKTTHVAPGTPPGSDGTPRSKQSSLTDRSASEQGPFSYDYYTSDDFAISLPGTGVPLDTQDPIDGLLDHPLSQSDQSAVASKHDAQFTAAPEYHPAPSLKWLEFICSNEMAQVLLPYQNGRHISIVDYGCGIDARLGVILLNHLRLTDSILLGLDRNKGLLRKLAKSFSNVALHSNCLYPVHGDYLKSCIGGADINVGNLHWSFDDPQNFIAGVQNMLGCAQITILFVPKKLVAAVKRLIELSFSAVAQPGLVEKTISFQTGRRFQSSSNHVYEGSFLCLCGGLAFRSAKKLRVAVLQALDLYSGNTVPSRRQKRAQLRDQVPRSYQASLDKYKETLGPLHSPLRQAGEPENWFKNNPQLLNDHFRFGVHVQQLVFFRPSNPLKHTTDPLDESEAFEILRQHLLQQFTRPNTIVRHVKKAVRLYLQRYRSFDLEQRAGMPVRWYNERRDSEIRGRGLRRWVTPVIKSLPQQNLHQFYDLDWLNAPEILNNNIRAEPDHMSGVNLSDANYWNHRAQGTEPEFNIQPVAFNDNPDAQALYNLSQNFPNRAPTTEQYVPLPIPASSGQLQPSCSECELMLSVLREEINWRLTSPDPELLRQQLDEALASNTTLQSELHNVALAHSSARESISLLTLARDRLAQDLANEQANRLQESTWNSEERSRLERLRHQLEHDLIESRRLSTVTSQTHNDVLLGYESAQADLAASNTERADLRRQLELAAQEGSDLRYQLDHIQRQLAQSEDRSRQLQDRIRQQEIAAQSDLLRNNQKAKTIVDKYILQYREEIESSNRSVSELNLSHAKQVAENNRLQANLRSLESINSQQSTQLQELTAALSSTRETAQSRTVSLQGEFTDQINTVSALLSQARTDLRAEQATSHKNLQDFNNARAEIQNLQRQLQQLSGDVQVNAQQAQVTAEARYQDALLSILRILESPRNSLSVLASIRALHVYGLQDAMDQLFSRDVTRLAAQIAQHQPWLLDLVRIQRLGSADNITIIRDMVDLCQEDALLAQRLVDLLASNQQQSNLHSELFLPIHLAESLRKWLTARVRHQSFVFPDIEHHLIDLVEVEMNNLYWFAFGEPVPRSDLVEYFDGQVILKYWASLAGDDQEWQVIHKDLHMQKYLLFLGLVSAVLPQRLVVAISDSLQHKPLYHNLLKVLMAGNNLSQTLHNMLFVMAVCFQSEKNWDLICDSFEQNDWNSGYCSHQALNPDDLLTPNESLSADIYSKCGRIYKSDEGEPCSAQDIYRHFNLDIRIGRILGLYFAPVSLNEQTPALMLLTTFQVVRFATVYSESMPFGQSPDPLLYSLISEIIDLQYSPELCLQETLSYFCTSLYGIKLELALQAAITLNDPEQASVYSRRVPGLIPLRSLDQQSESCLNGPHYQRCLDMVDDLRSHPLFTEFGEESIDECDNLLRNFFRKMDDKENLKGALLPPPEDFPIKKPSIEFSRHGTPSQRSSASTMYLDVKEEESKELVHIPLQRAPSPSRRVPGRGNNKQLIADSTLRYQSPKQCGPGEVFPMQRKRSPYTSSSMPIEQKEIEYARGKTLRTIQKPNIHAGRQLNHAVTQKTRRLGQGVSENQVNSFSPEI